MYICVGDYNISQMQTKKELEKQDPTEIADLEMSIKGTVKYFCIDEFNISQMQKQEKELEKQDLNDKIVGLEMSMKALTKAIDTMKTDVGTWTSASMSSTPTRCRPRRSARTRCDHLERGPRDEHQADDRGHRHNSIRYEH